MALQLEVKGAHVWEAFPGFAAPFPRFCVRFFGRRIGKDANFDV
jgi:hypothetical protein